MNVLTEFDPWRSSLCTCPPKLTLNPYTGCDHGCVYCYASSYIRGFSNCRPKKDLIKRLGRDAARLKGETVSISNSSDPYPNAEAQTELTRTCLEILSVQDCKIQIITKSSLVVRDADILKRVRSMVALTITTHDDNTAGLIEPAAPPPSERMRAVDELVQNGLPVVVRIDPIIPFLNDNPKKLIEKIASLGVRHITSSTYKVKLANWRRFSAAMPEVSMRLRPLYFERGERRAGYIYLPHSIRSKLMENVRELAEKNGVKIGTCRESLNGLNTAACDGSWLLRK